MQIEFLPTDDDQIPDAVRDRVLAVLATAHDDVVTHLPALSPRYLVTVRYDERTNVHTEEMGRLVTPYWLDWVVHPRGVRSPLEIVDEHLRASFVHETHHAVRAQLISATKPHPVGPENAVERSLLVPARTRRMVQIAVEEGLASRFEHDLCPGRPRLLAAPGEPVEEWTDELIALGDGDYFEWFFDHPSGRRHVGYKVGAHLADRAIERTGRSAADLVAVEVDDLCRLAGY
ncbi:hypothetical protein [Desertimonas flava]|uniref:hypothetical protein n=1 Tax=Desertimonas flava TaxID=2064846 RepID=UPI000E356824|nr:hypothetical protein [Desertimonas flava]